MSIILKITAESKSEQAQDHIRSEIGAVNCQPCYRECARENMILKSESSCRSARMKCATQGKQKPKEAKQIKKNKKTKRKNQNKATKTINKNKKNNTKQKARQ